MPAKKGRPSKFTPAMEGRVVELAARGHTDLEIAAELGVAYSTLKLWKEKHPEFSAALKDGKAIADAMVEKSLYNRAVGFTGPDGQYNPPHPTAGIFWLKNRKPQEWRDTTRSEITGADGGPVELQGPPRPSPEEVSKFSSELFRGFKEYIDEKTGEPSVLDAERAASLGEITARFASGEDQPGTRTPYQIGGFIAMTSAIRFQMRKECNLAPLE